MDISTGVFTARTDGAYAFSFHANTVRGTIESYPLHSNENLGSKIHPTRLQIKSDDSLILILRNGVIVGGAFDTDNFKYNTISQMVSPEYKFKKLPYQFGN